MNKENWQIKEYENLRQEIIWRISFLHQTISLAIIFLVVFIIAIFISITLNISRELLHTFLLVTPIIFILLGFNYQSNQSSLESISKYFEDVLKPNLPKKYNKNILNWDCFFAKEKKRIKIESSTKVLPFLAPSLIPFYFIFSGISLDKYQWVIIIVDIILLLIMIEHFRYKLRRVK